MTVRNTMFVAQYQGEIAASEEFGGFNNCVVNAVRALLLDDAMEKLKTIN